MSVSYNKKTLLRPKKIVWYYDIDDVLFIFKKIDDNTYEEYRNNRYACNREINQINPYITAPSEFISTYIKAFDKACFDEELNDILETEKEIK